LCFALASAGSSIPARMAMIAITTRNSIKVNAESGVLQISRSLCEHMTFYFGELYHKPVC
jgi:hypothetical protein